jgi:hypothetical protein
MQYQNMIYNGPTRFTPIPDEDFFSVELTPQHIKNAYTALSLHKEECHENLAANARILGESCLQYRFSHRAMQLFDEGIPFEEWSVMMSEYHNELQNEYNRKEK